MRLVFRFLSLKPECSFKVWLGLWLMPLDCISHGSRVDSGGGNHCDCFDSYSWPVDKLTVSCLCKGKYWCWFSKQSVKLWSDFLTLLSVCRSWAHTHTHAGWRETVPAAGELNSYTDLCSFTLGSWWMMFVWLSCSECAHTHSYDWNTHKLGVVVDLPSLVPLPCVDIGLCLEIFFFFFTSSFSISNFSVRKRQEPTETFFRLTGNQPISPS